jgi:hypothetical protein
VAARGERRPDDAVLIDVDAARIEATVRNAIDLCAARLGRVVAAIDADDVAGEGFGRAPGRVVHRARHDAIERETDLRVELRVERPCAAASAGRRAGTAEIADRVSQIEL